MPVIEAVRFKVAVNSDTTAHIEEYSVEVGKLHGLDGVYLVHKHTGGRFFAPTGNISEFVLVREEPDDVTPVEPVRAKRGQSR